MKRNKPILGSFAFLFVAVICLTVCSLGPMPPETTDTIEGTNDTYTDGTDDSFGPVEPVRKKGIQIGVTLVVSNVDTDGGVVTLEDGTEWEIKLIHRMKSRKWVPDKTSVKIEKNANPMSEEYNYTLITIRGKSKVSAKYLG